LSDAGGDVETQVTRSSISRRPIFGSYAALLKDSNSSDLKGGAENARVDNVGVDKSARRNRGGQRRSGQRGSGEA